MTTRSMYVTVLEFLFTGFTDISDFHVKGQFLAGQGVITININVKTADFKYRHLNLALVGLQIRTWPTETFPIPFRRFSGTR